MWEENQKIIECKYCQWKNLLTWTRDREGESEDMWREERLGWGETWLK